MKSPTSGAARAVAAAILAATLGPAFAASVDKLDFPRMKLRERVGGQRAVEQLGAQLPAVAKWYGKTDVEFASILRRDPSARLDKEGRLHYVEPMAADFAPEAGSTTAGSSPTASTYPLEQTLMLHSRPGAQRTLYLDFNGHTVTNTAWNAGYGLASIVSPPYDLDGLPYSFSQTELARIQAIWRRVAEDYAPFDIDVTTEEPPADALVRSSGSDMVFGTRVVITRDFVPGGCGCGGFAYLGVFDMASEYYKPAYVFYNGLAGGAEKPVAEAISHEAGHTFGLNHDGSSTTGYYLGQGSGETGWAPIMGAGYYKNLVQWSKGEYSGANNREDDFLVMQANLLPLRADDHGDSTAAASLLAGSGALAGNGVIERPTDRDLFRFTAGAGAASFALALAGPASNLDARLELLDAAGNLLASANPSTTLAASLATTLPYAGTYYLRVDGVGLGSPTLTGYSDYGSLGEYFLSASVPASMNQPPVARATATPTSGTAPLVVSLSGSTSYDPDGSVVAWEWNLGDGSPPVRSTSLQHTYAQGSYVATLTVTDAQGLSNSTSVAINANPPASVPQLHVQAITVTLRTLARNTTATAVVEVRDGNGNPVAGATVAGSWSGVVSGTSSALTVSTGKATLKSPTVRSNGSFIFTVKSISLSGYGYAAQQNLETSDSATK